MDFLHEQDHLEVATARVLNARVIYHVQESTGNVPRSRCLLGSMEDVGCGGGTLVYAGV